MTTQEEAPPTGAPAQRACPDWLALRREADTEARDTGAHDLLLRLETALRRQGRGEVLVVDLGAGTGANHAYLAPRLPLEQRWVVVDHDADLLDAAHHGDALRVEAGVCDLAEVLAGLPVDDGPLLLTCAALLDVLPTHELGCLADAVEGLGAVALVSLSVTGDVTWSPADEDDALVGRLFDAHQRRGGRPGPDAVDLLATDLRARGLEVLSAPTPWRLDDRRPELLERWLDERVEAALEEAAGGERERVLAWQGRRRQQLRGDGVVAVVDHVDLLVLPATDGAAGSR